MTIRYTTGGSAGICTSPSAAVTTACEQWELINDQQCYFTVRLTVNLWSSCKLFFCDWKKTHQLSIVCISSAY